MGRQNAATTVQLNASVLDVNVEDAITELVEECNGIDKLVNQVARIEVETKVRMVSDRVECTARRVDIVGNFGRVYLKPKADTMRGISIHDRCPPVSKVTVANVDVSLRGGRKEIQL